MNKQKQKLELTWIGKEKRPRLEPRILLEDKALSYQADVPEQDKAQSDFFTDSEEKKPEPTSDNILIHGDNLLALKSLEHQYAGKVKSIVF